MGTTGSEASTPYIVKLSRTDRRCVGNDGVIATSYPTKRFHPSLLLSIRDVARSRGGRERVKKNDTDERALFQHMCFCRERRAGNHSARV